MHTGEIRISPQNPANSFTASCASSQMPARSSSGTLRASAAPSTASSVRVVSSEDCVGEHVHEHLRGDVRLAGCEGVELRAIGVRTTERPPHAAHLPAYGVQGALDALQPVVHHAPHVVVDGDETVAARRHPLRAARGVERQIAE